MLDSAYRTIDAVFRFLLQGHPPQQVIPWFLAGVALVVIYMLLRMSRGDVK